jgi:alpha-tubulin suppressor-like RCC1 family protein
MRTSFLLTLGALTLAALPGCRQDAESPTAPVTEPAPLATWVTPPVFRQVSAGGSHGCGVTTENQLYCWGNNNTGQLGTGTTSPPSRFPVAVATTLRFRMVSAGATFTCGVTGFDGLYCWGENNYGQLGNGTRTDSPRPVRVATNIRIRAVSAGAHHACAVSIGDIVYCWGRNDFGQIGDGTRTDRPVPTRPAGWSHFSSVSAGNGFSCGLTTTNAVTPPDRIYCWGEAGNGHYGNDAWHDNLLRPNAVPGGLTFAGVESGYSHVCGVTPARKAYCWGANQAWLGSVPPAGSGDFQVTPRAVAGGHAFRAVAGGTYWSCGVTTDNVGYCWGDRTFGVGNGVPGGSWTPVQVAGGLHFSRIEAGGQFACGLTTDGKVYCWGDFDYGPTPFLVSR